MAIYCIMSRQNHTVSKCIINWWYKQIIEKWFRVWNEIENIAIVWKCTAHTAYALHTDTHTPTTRTQKHKNTKTWTCSHAQKWNGQKQLMCSQLYYACITFSTDKHQRCCCMCFFCRRLFCFCCTSFIWINPGHMTLNASWHPFNKYSERYELSLNISSCVIYNCTIAFLWFFLFAIVCYSFYCW